MAYYIREIPNGHFPEAWWIGDDDAYCLGISNPIHYRAEPGETAFDVLRRDASAWFEPPGFEPFHKASLEPGQFYPRIARPAMEGVGGLLNMPVKKHSDTNFVITSRSQLATLVRQLELICQTVHPVETTFDAFGHNIRNLLILACTEVESHWRGVLDANGIRKDRYTTQDYVKLQQAMKLEDFELAFPSFPWLDPIRPFAGWTGTGASPTQTLPWYAAYNAAKHNREHEFEKANLRTAFEAVTACAVMMIAQFGLGFGLGLKTELSAFFHVASFPQWPLGEFYIPAYSDASEEDLERNYPFP
jgi:hypothetical protein